MYVMHVTLSLQVQFMLGGNGRVPSPVDVVASSGEKSRLLLLIEVTKTLYMYLMLYALVRYASCVTVVVPCSALSGTILQYLVVLLRHVVSC
jgi:hypothetical protein